MGGSWSSDHESSDPKVLVEVIESTLVGVALATIVQL